MTPRSREFLDNDHLRGCDNGVNYFLTTLRPYFAEGAQNVFLYRVLNLFNHRRGNQEFMTIISNLEILLRRLRASWMDTMLVPELTQVPQQPCRLQPCCLRSMAGRSCGRWSGRKASAERPAESYWSDRTHENQYILTKWFQVCQDRHMSLFPITNSFVVLLFIIQPELPDGQREHLTSKLQNKGSLIHLYDPLETIKQKYYDLFIMSRTAIQDPSICLQNKQQRSFWIVDLGEYEGEKGFWVEDDEKREEGFIHACR